MLKVGSLSSTHDLRPGDLVRMDCSGRRLPIEDVIAAESHHARLAVDFVHEVLNYAELLICRQLALLRHIFKSISL